MNDFQTEGDDLTYRLVEAYKLTYRLVEAYIDDGGTDHQLVGEVAQHPDLIAVLINLGHLAAALALALNCGGEDRPLDDPDDPLARYRLTDEQKQRSASAAKRDVEELLRFGGAN